MYAHKLGVSMGSRVAPVFSDLLLAYYDGNLEEKLEPYDWVRILRFVEDFLVIFRTHPEGTSNQVEIIFSIIVSSCFPGLTFTPVLPAEGKIHFLDMEMHFGRNHSCCS
ncbi:hypothetical protein MTO96_031848 [Rhipicephalus appendiculatus]